MRKRHPLFRRLLWNPFVVAIPLAQVWYTAYQRGFPVWKTAAACFIALWFAMSVFDALSRHRLLNWMYSDEATGLGETGSLDDDALRFREVVASYGGVSGNLKPELVAFLSEKDVSERAIEYLAGYVLETSGGVSAIDFYSQDGLLGANAEKFVPIAIRDGLLIVGSCPNGDPVAVDLREHLGAAGYIGHETMWQVENVREVFVVLAPGLGALAAGLERDTMPLDYYAATLKK